MKAKAIATFARTDGIAATDVEFVQFEGERKLVGKHSETGEDVYFLYTNTAGQYLVVRSAGDVVAVYKVQIRFGAGKAVAGGGVMVDSMSVGLKRIKRAPKGLI